MLRPPRHSRCLAKGVLLSLPPSRCHHCLSPGRRCSNSEHHSENLRSIKNTGNNLTLKQMFDISEKLIVGHSDEIYGISKINWDDSSLKHLSLVRDEEVISLSHAKVCTYFQILCYALER